MTVMVNENVPDIQQVYLLRKSIIIKSIFVFFLPISDNNNLKKKLSMQIKSHVSY